MAVGDIAVARQDTLEATKTQADNIKSVSDNIKVSADKLLENKTPGISINTIVLTSVNVWYDAVSITGSGYVTYVDVIGAVVSTSYSAQIVVDGATYDLGYITNTIRETLSGLIKFNSSFKLRIKGTSSNDQQAYYKCLYSV